MPEKRGENEEACMAYIDGIGMGLAANHLGRHPVGRADHAAEKRRGPGIAAQPKVNQLNLRLDRHHHVGAKREGGVREERRGGEEKREDRRSENQESKRESKRESKKRIKERIKESKENKRMRE